MLQFVPTTRTILALLLTINAVEPRIRAYPKIALNGTGVRVEVFIPRHPDNRRLRVEIDGDQFFRAFEEPLEGDDARALFSITIEKLPTGNYIAGAAILKSNGKVEHIPYTTFCRGDACIQEDE